MSERDDADQQRRRVAAACTMSGVATTDRAHQRPPARRRTADGEGRSTASASRAQAARRLVVARAQGEPARGSARSGAGGPPARRPAARGCLPGSGRRPRGPARRRATRRWCSQQCLPQLEPGPAHPALDGAARDPEQRARPHAWTVRRAPWPGRRPAARVRAAGARSPTSPCSTREQHGLLGRRLVLRAELDQPLEHRTCAAAAGAAACGSRSPTARPRPRRRPCTCAASATRPGTCR